MMTKEDITKAALSLRKQHGVVSARELCKILEADLDEVSLGTGPNSIKGMVLECNKLTCVTINADMSMRNKDLTIYHECGHIVCRHTSLSAVTCNNLFARRESSIMEIEANEFVVEYILDNEEVLRTLKETNCFYNTARILRVTPDMLYYKWRMLEYYGLISGDPPIRASSDCMGRIGTDGIDDNCFWE